ncbi:hypothetical protein [[Eubacterium] hominis]|uniref:hypothetical protein n=1 Tax=[Eubacterium] hominis TaxID=2764325 RepID=UPI003A4D6F43
MLFKQKIKIGCAVLMMSMGLFSTSFVLNRQMTGDEVRVKNFYQLTDNSIDMMIIGASTSYTDFSAPLAWHKYGITSYSLATNMAPMGLAKSMLIEARKYQNAKLFVIDINGILYNDEYETKEGSLRLWIDNMKYSKNKIDTIRELIPQNERMSYYIPFLKYHSNWDKGLECLKAAKQEIDTWRDPVNLSILGVEGRTRMQPMNNVYSVANYKKESNMYEKSGQHLKELLEYCKNEDLSNVVFTNMPRYYNDKMLPQRERLNTAKRLIQEYGYRCIDLDDYVEEIGLDPKTDFYNPNHLNIYGQTKTTYFLMDMLLKDYHLKGEHDNSDVERWNKEYETYKKVYQWVDWKIKHGEDQRYTYVDVKNVIDGKFDKEIADYGK